MKYNFKRVNSVIYELYLNSSENSAYYMCDTVFRMQENQNIIPILKRKKISQCREKSMWKVIVLGLVRNERE